MKKQLTISLIFISLLGCGKKEEEQQSSESSPLAITEDAPSLQFNKPEISTLTNSLDFQKSATKTISIRNEGSRPLTISNISIHKNVQFAIGDKSTCIVDQRIQGKQSCIIDISYTALDNAVTDILTIATRESNSLTIDLTGASLIKVDPPKQQNVIQAGLSEADLIRLAQEQLSYQFMEGAGTSSSEQNLNPYYIEEAQAEVHRPIGILAGNSEVLNNAMVTPSVDKRRVVGAGTKITLVLENEVRLGQESTFTAYAAYPVYGGYAPKRNKITQPVLELIPKGTRFEGTVSQFQGTNNRLNMALLSMETPMGNYIQFSKPLMAGSRDGSSGVVSRSNYRWGGRYAPSIMFNVISASILNESGDLVVGGENDDLETSSGRTRALDQLAEDAKELGKTISEDISNVSPVFYIPKATVMVVELSHQTGGLYFVSEGEAIPLSAFGGQDKEEESYPPEALLEETIIEDNSGNSRTYIQRVQ